MKRIPSLLLLLHLVCLGPLGAQAIPDTIFSAATTTTDAAGRPWAYVAFTPENNGVLRGRALAVYLKNGLPADPGTFTRQGVVSPELEASLLSVFIERGAKMGEDLVELDEVLYDIYRTRGESGNQLSSPLPAPPKPPLAEMLSSLLNRATGDAETASSMRLLGMNHPSVRMALGEAWAGPLTAAIGQPVTIEVREWSTAGDGGVVARLTLTAGQPVVLPPPGPPVQVPDLTPKGDLNIKLRWGQDENLRRQSPLSAGFNVWRVSKDFAIANGVDAAPPSLPQLKSWLASGDAKRAAERAVIPDKVLSLAQAADVAGDETTHFITDDGNRFRTNEAGQPVDEPFVEDEQYTYFITTRDILGRDGPPSPPGHGIVCRTLPPPVPSNLRVENHWSPDAGAATGQQTIQFLWKANTNTARDVTTYYEIYRGADLTALQSVAGKQALELNHVLATQLHETDGAVMAWLDDSPETAAKGFGETLWYSVRAVHMCPLGPIRSDFAAPVTIAKRQREGPEAPSGFVQANCGRASVIFSNQQTVTPPGLPLNDGLIRLRLLCQRLDPGIAHVDLSVRVGSQVIDLGQHLYGGEGDIVAADYEIHTSELPGQSLTVICQSTTHTGMSSNAKEQLLEGLTSEGRREVTFQTKTLSNADLAPGEVFSDELLEDPVSAPAVATPEGMGFALPPSSLNGRVVVIQTSNAGGFSSNWITRGHGTVRDSQVHFAFPSAPSQPALSGRVFAVREFGGTCSDLAYTPGSGTAGKLGIVVFTTARSEEYRIFRRINEGPYTLVGQGAASYANTNPVNAIRREDEALPMTDCTICYYAQTVDRDGNASALVRLEPCIERKAPTLPKPRLSPPSAIGTVAEPKMKLTWTCPPQGVERFLITIKAKGGPAARSELELGNSTAFSLAAPVSPALANRQVHYMSSEDDGKANPTQQAPGPGSQSANAGNRAFLNLGSAAVTYAKMINTSSFVTPPLGNGFPSEPPFTAEFTVQAGVVYEVFVQAVRGAMLNGQGRGPKSLLHEFKWEETIPGDPPKVAWPPRPMPEVTLVNGVAAAELDPVMWPAHLNGERPVGVKLVSLRCKNVEDYPEIANEIVYAPAPDSPGFKLHDPNANIPSSLQNGSGGMQGVVLYRQQVANQLFPTVPGDVIQVSPLVRKIAWIPTTVGGRNGARLIDPFFALRLTAPPDAEHAVDLYLLDTQGVINGARYHYYLVCFGADGEITQTIDAGFYGPN
ncbi:MAG: hypothetical protein MUF13_01670 [Akkermansiaceae bacterium]|nr:hypothetical protein [Akkermansiaceae bacterium]